MSLFLSSLLVILLLELLYHFTLLHNTKLIYKALHNTTFLSDYCIFYCFLFLSRISLISTSPTMPALTTVLPFSKTSAHPSVLHTYIHTSDFTILPQVPLLQNPNRKPSKQPEGHFFPAHILYSYAYSFNFIFQDRTAFLSEARQKNESLLGDNRFKKWMELLRKSLDS